MERLLLVANPAASGFTASLHGDVARILASRYRVDEVWPEGPDQARRAAERAAGAGYAVVAAMGGDGVSHAIANGVHQTSTALAIVPAGTTNVLQRVLGLPRRPRDAAEMIVSAGKPGTVATLRLDHSGPQGGGRRIATFAAGIGFDAEVIRESERRPLSKVGFGAVHYARSALRVAFSGYRDRLPTLRVDGDGRSADAVGVVVQIHDDFTYLGKRALRLGPGPGPVAASIARVTPGRLVRLVARAGRGARIDRIRGVHLWRGFTSMRVRAEPEALLEADGELVGAVSEVTLTSLAEGLLVVGVR